MSVEVDNNIDIIDLSYEPMDIDLSNTSGNRLNSSQDDKRITPISMIKKQKLETTIKKYHIKINRKKTKTHMQMKTLTMILILIIAVVTYQIFRFKCSSEFDLQELKQTLLRNIFGQERAVETIIETLSINVSSKILLFYGGTGVGKTFATSLIIQNDKDCSNIYYYTMPSFADSFSSEFMLGLSFCKSSVLIVDDLTINDVHIKSHIKDVISKSENVVNNITIILIFNCDSITENFVKKCDQKFYAALKEGFSDVRALKNIVYFKPLSQKHLRMCVEKELGNKKVNEVITENILKNFNVTLDGCKGVYKKIKFLNVL